jgi:HD-GYP domain-containing protein (c-di-GMP phosphodiesterase class II)
MGTILRLSEIPTDRPLSEALYDTEGALVMRCGTRVTDQILKQFADRGFDFLELGEPEAPYLRTARAVENQFSGSSGSSTATVTAPPPAASTAPTPADCPASTNSSAAAGKEKLRPYDPEVSGRVTHLATRASAVVSDLGIALVDGTLRDAAPIHEVAEQFLNEIRGDCDQVVAETISNPNDQELAVRSVQMSVLSMAICRAMKLPEADWATAGSAAMLHDMALFRLPEAERYPHALMKAESRQVYESHPALAYDMLEKVRDIDGTVRIIVLQTHEQADGSGFPRRITLPRIHKLARVLNVADSYIRLVGCGCDGQRIFPADAMAYLMHHSCAGRFDPAVTCALIKVVSLYPLGSLVQLNNYTSARVIRCNPDSPLRPVVVPEGESRPIDLSESHLSVGDPIDDPELGRRRLPSGEFDRILW